MSVALFSAISGLGNFQRMLDVVANNIANINTPGYKARKVNFEELLSQTFRGASAPAASRGGTNALQLGLGSTVGSIDAIFKQGALESTGSLTDLAITGDGFFVVSDGRITGYTRNGHLTVDVQGNLVDSSGRKLQGWMASSNGTVDLNKPLTDLKIRLGEAMSAQATSSVTFAGNLDGSADVYAAGPPETGGKYVTEVTVYDAQGKDYRVTLTFTRTNPPSGAASAWDWRATLEGSLVGNGTIALDGDGRFDPVYSTSDPLISITPTNGADTLEIRPDFTGVTQLYTPGEYTLVARTQDGFPAGTLQSFSIDRNGVIQGAFTNGFTRPQGQIALAFFINPAGLQKVDGGLMVETANSGAPQLGPPGNGPRGQLTSSSLEMSNVDLSTEFTRLIIAQRAFQANSRVIRTMDEVLNELSNLRR